MLQGEHSSRLLTFIKLPFVIKIFVLSIFVSGRFTQVLIYVHVLIILNDIKRDSKAYTKLIFISYLFRRNLSQGLELLL